MTEAERILLEKGASAGSAASSEPTPWTLVSSAERETIRWLWPGWLACGKIALLDGDPGLGKSTLIADLAARITRGLAMPDDDGPGPGPGQAGGVVLVSGEDGLTDTIRPRLEEAGADLVRIAHLAGVPERADDGSWTERRLTIPSDVPTIEQAVHAVGARLVVIDPLMAHLESDTNSFRDQDVRAALTPLARMAERLMIAVLIVRHLNKASGGHSLYRGGGSIGIIGQARTAWIMGRMPVDSDMIVDDDALVLASNKINVGRRPDSLALRIVSSPNDPDVGIVQWEGKSRHTAQDLVSVQHGKKSDGPKSEAAMWLEEMLGDGEAHAARDMWRAATDAGHSERTVRRALKSLGVDVERRGGLGDEGGWFWTLRLSSNGSGSLSKNSVVLDNPELPVSNTASGNSVPTKTANLSNGMSKKTPNSLRLPVGGNKGAGGSLSDDDWIDRMMAQADSQDAPF